MSAIGEARQMLAAGKPVARVRAVMVKRYGGPRAYKIMQVLRMQGTIPPRASKIRVLQVSISPAVRARVKRIAEAHEVLPARIARQAFLAGLALIEARAP